MNVHRASNKLVAAGFQCFQLASIQGSNCSRYFIRFSRKFATQVDDFDLNSSDEIDADDQLNFHKLGLPVRRERAFARKVSFDVYGKRCPSDFTDACNLLYETSLWIRSS